MTLCGGYDESRRNGDRGEGGHGRFDGVDILANNVGGTAPGDGFSTLTDEHWLKELGLNLLSHHAMAR